MKHCKNCGSILFKIGNNNQPVCANCGSNGVCEKNENKETPFDYAREICESPGSSGQGGSRPNKKVKIKGAE